MAASGNVQMEHGRHDTLLNVTQAQANNGKNLYTGKHKRKSGSVSNRSLGKLMKAHTQSHQKCP